MTEPTTNAAIRDHFEGEDGAYTETLAPGNGSAVAPSQHIRVAKVNPDGTNTVDLSNNERTGHTLVVVHNGGSSTPTVAFDDSDFVGTGPEDLVADGEFAVVYNRDGSASGWVGIDETPRRRTVTDSPGNGADTTIAADTEVHVVNPDGTNSVVPDNVAQAGHVVTVVHNGGSNTPTLSFTDADFVGTGPSNITSAGASATLLNTDGSTSGWVVVATGSA